MVSKLVADELARRPVVIRGIDVRVSTEAIRRVPSLMCSVSRSRVRVSWLLTLTWVR